MEVFPFFDEVEVAESLDRQRPSALFARSRIEDGEIRLDQALPDEETRSPA